MTPTAAQGTASAQSAAAASTPSPPSLSTYLSTHPDYRFPSSPSSPLASLYSSLSSLRTSNPAAYRANLNWWAGILCQVVWKGVQRDNRNSHDGSPAGSISKGKEREVDRLVLHVDEEMLQDWTVEEIGRPMGIGTVVLDMASSSHLVPLQRFLSSTSPIAGPSRGGASSASRSYIPSPRAVVGFVVGKPLWWALSNLGITGGGEAAEEDDDQEDSREWRKARGKWVIWDNVDRAASTFLAAHYSQATFSPLDYLFTMSTFRARLLAAQPHLTETDIQVVLKHLCRDRRVAQVEKGLVKLAGIEGEEVENITEQDRGLVTIKETHDRLEKQVEELQRRMADCDNKIQAYLRSSSKAQALSSLKMKKHLSTILSKRLDSLSTLSSILLKIEQTAGDASILGSYETATQVLGSLLADPRLQRERVDSTMDRLEQVVADQKEIDEAVMEGGERVRWAAGDEVDVDEEELREEMKRLEEEDLREKREAEQEEIRRKERKEKNRREEEHKEKLRKLAQEQQEREAQRRKEAEQEKEQEQERQRTLAAARRPEEAAYEDAAAAAAAESEAMSTPAASAGRENALQPQHKEAVTTS